MYEQRKIKVALSSCDRYHPDAMRQSLQELFAPWGGISYFVKPDMRVLLKPNLLAATSPEEAVTTHPVVIRILAEFCREAGAKVCIGDSPAGKCSWELLYRSTGMQEAAEGAGALLLEFSESLDTRISEWTTKGKRVRTLPLTRVLSEVDLVINTAKLKTHTLTGLTAAVKNIYGCVVGKTKGQLHREYPRPLDFAGMILDIYQTVKPALSVLDAVIAMEGTGPRGGSPRQVGLMIASDDGHALDLVAATVTGFTPEQVPTLAVARRRNLPGAFRANLEIHGLDLEDAAVRGFDRGAVSGGKIGKLMARFPGSWLRNRERLRRPYPRVNPGLCTGCAACFRHCPPQIIRMSDNRAKIEQSRCIRCYCCLELCPSSAISLFPR